MDALGQLSIVSDAAAGIFAAAGLLCLAWLVWGGRGHIIRWVLPALALSAAAMVVFRYLAEQVWNLWGAPLPVRNYVFAGLAVFAVLLVIPKILSLHCRVGFSRKDQYL